MKKYFKFSLIFLIIFELTSFVFSKLELLTFNNDPVYNFKEDRLLDWIILDENNLKTHKKNYKTSHVTRCFDVNYEFNNVGARDNEDYYLDYKTNNTMLIGDSFAEGYGVNLDNTFAKVLENKINKKILNFGLSDTNPKSQYKKYLLHDSKFNFDELIYFFLPFNDYLTNTQKKKYKNTDTKKYFNFEKYKTSIANFLARFTYSYNFIRSIAHLLDINFYNSFKNKSYFYNNKNDIDYTFTYIDKILDLKKVKSYIVIIPTTYDLANHFNSDINYKELYWYKKLNNLAKKNDSVIIDLLDFMNFKEKYKYFHSCDGHWNANGNNFAVDTFLKFYK